MKKKEITRRNEKNLTTSKTPNYLNKRIFISKFIRSSEEND